MIPIKLPVPNIGLYDVCEAEVTFDNGYETWDNIEYNEKGEIRVRDHDGNIHTTIESLKACGVREIQFFLKAEEMVSIIP